MECILSPKIVLSGARRAINITGSKRSLISKQLMYKDFGNPADVVNIEECEVPCLRSKEVLVRMLAAPVNPADINTIQGKYPVKISLPSIAGNEGVGIVEDVAEDVERVSPGNKVIMTTPGMGTWRTLAVFNETKVRQVPDELGLAEAATLTVNPCAVYRMLSDFIPVREKCPVVIQNGANSACGQTVIQMCNAWGVKTINIIRDRDNVEDLKRYLVSLGADHVLTEKELQKTNIFKEKIIERPALALNCIGGKNSLGMLKHLKHSGIMVTYGGMSKKPVIIPTGSFIFKNLTFVGFWLTAWHKKAKASEKDEMLMEIIDLMCTKKLRAPLHKILQFEKYKEALDNALKSKGCKYIIKLS